MRSDLKRLKCYMLDAAEFGDARRLEGDHYLQVAFVPLLSVHGISAASAQKAVRVTAKYEGYLRDALAAAGTYPILNDKRGLQTCLTRANVISMYNGASRRFDLETTLEEDLDHLLHPDFQNPQEAYIDTFFQDQLHVPPSNARKIKLLSEASQNKWNEVNPQLWDWYEFSDAPKSHILDDRMLIYDILDAQPSHVIFEEASNEMFLDDLWDNYVGLQKTYSG